MAIQVDNVADTSECKKREGYDKPGVKRREAKKAGIKNARKREKNNKD